MTLCYKLAFGSLLVLCAGNDIKNAGFDEILEPRVTSSRKETVSDQMRKAPPPSPRMTTKSSRTEADYGSSDGMREDTDEAGKVDSSDTLIMIVAHQMGKDPLVLTSSVLLLAYLVGQMAFGVGKKAAPEPVAAKPKKPRQVTQKSQFAVSVNQKLMQLQSWDEILDCIISFQGRTDAVNVVTAIHRSTKLALSSGSTRKLLKDSRLNVLIDELRTRLQDDLPISVRTRAVGNTSWALAKLNYRDVVEDETAILKLLQASFVEFSVNFKPEELMNTVWAFAELSRDAKENEDRALKVAKAAVKCHALFPEFSVQQVVYFSWALARLSTVPSVRADNEVVAGLIGFKKLIVERATPEVSALTTKNLAMVSWATAHLHKVRQDQTVPVTMLLAAVAEDCSRRGLRHFAAGELASIVWALSKCQVHHAGFYNKFRVHLVQNGTTGFSSQDLANVICAFVNAEQGDDDVYKVLADSCSKNTSFNRLEKTMVNWAFSQLPHIAAPKVQ
jgi:hypothetical protein